MQKIIAYPLSIIYYILFGVTLIVFHVIQWLAFNLFGYKAHKKSVDWLCFFLVANTYVLGTRYKIRNMDKIPVGVPLIIAANHQSFYDITTIGWFFRKVHPKFISKIELGKGIPSISYNLRNGGSVLINRQDPRQSLAAIKEMGLYIEKYNRSTVIFPEGTRSKNGQPKAFAVNGLKILCRNAPSSYVLPVTINNSWKMTRWGSFPFGIGNKIELIIHDPISVRDNTFEYVFEKTEKEIVKAIV